jgi:ATP-binding cassette, subfamily B, bacterial MsbA
VWRYRGRALLVLALGSLAGVLQGAPLVFLYPFVNSIFPPSGSANPSPVGPSRVLPQLESLLHGLQPHLTAWLPGLSGGKLGDPDRVAFLLAIGVATLLVTLLGAAAHFAFIQSSRGLSLRILADLREDLAQHVLKLGMRYHTGSRKGDLLSRATNDVAVVLAALALFFDDLILEPAQLAGKIALAVVGSPWLTLLVVVLVPAIFLPLVLFGRRIRKGTRRSLSALGESTEAMSQMFSGIRVVKAFRMEEREMREFRETNQRWIDRALSVVRAKAMTEASTHVLTNGGFAILIVGIGIANLRLNAFADVGAMAVWFAGFATMYQHIRRISKGYQTVQESLGAADRLFEILDLAPSIPQRGSRPTLPAPIATLELRNVGFAYDGEKVLDGISVQIRAGETVAVVGPSGGGKSTLVDLLARFYDPQEGSVRVNGIDIRELDPEAWIRCWALVDQNPFLFHASIGENVAYGKPGATPAEIRSALAAAGMLDFVDSLPSGLDTEVGDRGARLSGGQRQRLTIARALLKDAPILLLDEATSSLDSESEAAVREALDRLMVGRTSIVVAHRLSTIRGATRILVLDRGRIVEEGRHDELLRAGGAYRRLYEMQLGVNGG